MHRAQIVTDLLNELGSELLAIVQQGQQLDYHYVGVLDASYKKTGMSAYVISKENDELEQVLVIEGEMFEIFNNHTSRVLLHKDLAGLASKIQSGLETFANKSGVLFRLSLMP